MKAANIQIVLELSMKEEYAYELLSATRGIKID